MALRTLVLRSRLDKAKKDLEELRKKDGDFAKREEEIVAAVNEMDENTSEEDRNVVEQQADDFQREKDAHDGEKSKLEEQIEELEKNIEEEEKKQREAAAPKDKSEERKEGNKMINRTKFFGMDIQERDAFFANENVKNFISKVRTCIEEKRALTNVGLTIPDNVLPLIKQVAENNSKLLKYVTVRQVRGTSRQNILGEIPEAFWDDQCAALKEMDLAFYNMEMDGYKVSGYFAVCNAILEDNDVNLMTELINAIGRAIAKALDKAILYGRSGTNKKMPLGVITALKMASEPEGYPDTGRAWEDLTKTHLITGAAATGAKLFADITLKSAVIDNDYDTSDVVWIMNRTTKSKLLSESIGSNTSAAIVAGMNNSMPVIGGNIETFKFIPDDTIIFGYFKNYNLVERSGAVLDQSSHVRFIEDQTVFRGRARYDGAPAIREAFAVYGIGKAPNTDAPLFAGEVAEPDDGE